CVRGPVVSATSSTNPTFDSW
nr:immunoglobulin heavy chain junction region [Macaca mulatta]